MQGRSRSTSYTFVQGTARLEARRGRETQREEGSTRPCMPVDGEPLMTEADHSPPSPYCRWVSRPQSCCLTLTCTQRHFACMPSTAEPTAGCAIVPYQHGFHLPFLSAQCRALASQGCCIDNDQALSRTGYAQSAGSRKSASPFPKSHPSKEEHHPSQNLWRCWARSFLDGGNWATRGPFRQRDAQGASTGAHSHSVALTVRRYMNDFESRQLHASAHTIGKQLVACAAHAWRRHPHVRPCTCVLHWIPTFT